MDNPTLVAVLAIIGFLIVYFLVVLALAGGKMQRIILLKKAGIRILRDNEFAKTLEEMLSPPPLEPETPPKPDGTPIRVLTLLQREGRLLDFLMEDIQSYPNEQIGAAVRDIHSKCQAALKEHLVFQPVLNKSEGEQVEVGVGFDPSAVQVTGNVTGEPPFKGTLQHHGWRVTEIKLSKPGEGVDELVVQPAEVEMA